MTFDPFLEEYSFWTRHERDFIAESETLRFMPAGCARVLDLGCGPGFFSRRLFERCSQGVALDLTMGFLRQLQDGIDGSRMRVCADINALPLKPGSFDFISSFAVLHEVEFEPVMLRIKSLLRDGGRLVVWDLVERDGNRSKMSGMRGALAQFPARVRLHGWRVAVRITRFMMSRAWIQHDRSQTLPDEEQFEQRYTRLLPGCHFVQRRLMTGVFWQAPGRTAGKGQPAS